MTPRHSIEFSGTKYQEAPIKFYTSTRYTLCESEGTPYVNPYFDLYTEYHVLEGGDNTRVNGIGGLINPKYLDTISLNLKDETG